MLNPALPNDVEGVRTAFPKDVSKLFFKKEAYDKALLTGDRMATLVGDESHRITPYIRTLRGSNLTPSVQTECRIKPEDPLFPVRMPYLGRDISDIQHYYRDIRALSVGIILDQIVKLTTQVKRLFEAGYIHGDIRELNVMVHPGTGMMTLIDFDYLKPKKEFITDYAGNFGYYSNPPESLLLRLFRYGEQETVFNKYYTMANVYKSTKISKDEIHEAILDSRALFLERNLKDFTAISDEIMRSFDSYGLGLALDWFLHNVYSFIDTREPTEAHLVAAESRLSNKGMPYDKPTIIRIFHTIYDIKQIVKQMVALKARARIDILVAHARILAVVEDWTATAGGKRRATRRQRRKRRL